MDTTELILSKLPRKPNGVPDLEAFPSIDFANRIGSIQTYGQPSMKPSKTKEEKIITPLIGFGERIKTTVRINGKIMIIVILDANASPIKLPLRLTEKHGLFLPIYRMEIEVQAGSVTSFL